MDSPSPHDQGCIAVMSSLLSVANGRDLDMKVTDFVRFYLNVWPFPNSALNEERKYFEQVYVTLNEFLVESFDVLLGMWTGYGWNRKDLLETLRRNLPEHTRLLYDNPRLSYLAGQHTGAALSIETEIGMELNGWLLAIKIKNPLTIFRTLSRDYQPELRIGDISETKDIWSTSYDPISSLGFALADGLEMCYVMRACVPAMFKGGLLTENNLTDTVKVQHEYILAAGIQFEVVDIFEAILDVPDDMNNVRTIQAKVYDIKILRGDDVVEDEDSEYS